MILAVSTIQTLLFALIVFMIIILLLVAMLLIARDRLMPKGDVQLLVNDREMTVSPGSNLLTTLSSNGIFLPSACGGMGTCGMCKCRILEGGGSILATETGFFTRKEQLNNWRLSCQVKIREPLKIEVPESVLGIRKWQCEVVSNKNVATFIKEFVVRLPDGEELNFDPGGYIQIDVPKYSADYRDFAIEEEFHADWDNFKVWDFSIRNTEETFRAYSMANYPAEKNLIKLNIRIATPPWDNVRKQYLNVPPGICSSYIFSLKPGDKVMISGPYGEFHIKDTDNEMVYIGGGAGMAPLRSHIFHLFHTLKTNRKVSYWYGARSLREVFYEEEFREIERRFPNFRFHLALSAPLPEDNWTGLTGNIHQVLLDNYLKMHDEPEDIEYYFCGPPVMNDAVLNMLDNLGVPSENISFDDFGI
ncbi:MAG TPA: NADH:ubiquinone reductase (Na(+)-transporting) subunit F [Bacteroidales bacterium]|jgi:Na+-transporting NADH:ubiquinone oxidoreductase subunit F|nr:NADH:ubiquinone reductase (Na(+)-transporting) subunit F [Bacteroidales bacterium]HOS73227.1 NADH:ubiquinone reductase (Na(+)-transporting) subunit F [Bacteroidales bacterium]HQH22806.1 NADH:ubiquinone reductase (Na(+)-transporting) subunit F [Bacteroidales bacterium]HQJ81728.1 NADH:ubiquinone reductase (Na(+)-transporting) subunit F [Bacteroidales bacterium]